MSSQSYQTKKRFGQNFLHDKNIIEKIIRSINPQPHEPIVEVGPGLGALTLPLIEAKSKVTVVEIDHDLIQHWESQQHSNPEAAPYKIVPCDALSVDFNQLAHKLEAPKIRLVGNLPYNISTPLLFHFLQYADVIEDMHFMLQKEVVDRMAASAGSKVYGRLTVMLASHCQVQPLFTVPPTCFSPPPKVDSAIVRLRPQTQPRFPIGDSALFSKVVAAAFSQRRKTIRNTLKTLTDSATLNTALAAAEITPTARPETLAPRDFGRLTVALLNSFPNTPE